MKTNGTERPREIRRQKNPGFPLSNATVHAGMLYLTNTPTQLSRLFYIYKASVRALFILAILEETLRSMVRSPISTTRPPTRSGLTWLMSVEIRWEVEVEMQLKTYGGDNLELLALAELGLGNGLLETGDGLGVELLD